MSNRKSTALGLVSLAGFTVLLAGTAFAPPSQAQSATPPTAAPGTVPPAALTGCPAGGFDVCFPNLLSGAPNAACTTTEAGSAVVSECLARVCRSAAAEPQPGFFSYCCARGGALEYDDFCVFALQSACGAVAAHCADRCPPLQLLIGTVTLAPPPPACIPTYPAFIGRVCEQDDFCCSTSWDGICAEAALAAGGSAFAAAAAGAAPSPALPAGGVLPGGGIVSAAASSLVNAPAVISVAGPSVISVKPAAASSSAAP